jgi:hypothetical protein
MSLLDAKIYTFYIAIREGHMTGEPGLSASTIEELQAKIKEKFTYPKNMEPENVIYWEEYRKSLKIAKETTIIELI